MVATRRCRSTEADVGLSGEAHAARREARAGPAGGGVIGGLAGLKRAMSSALAEAPMLLGRGSADIAMRATRSEKKKSGAEKENEKKKNLKIWQS
jgi:hypothetical protein